MSSLAAARADNFYYAPDFDPDKHGTLNKYNGQHALRDRAKNIDKGILVIRFEVPFHIWCTKCGEKIAQGERFNADKRGIGHYHSTRIWQFSMRHHCGCIITIQSDPKHCDYIVVEGAKKKVGRMGSHEAC
ncbi:CWC16 protein [Haematococcus lacustris]